MEKHCPDCNTTKPAADFYVNKQHRDGLSTYCKPCSVARASTRYVRKERYRAPAGMKWCNRCKTEQPVENFHANRHSYDGRASYCKVCATESVVASRRRNPGRHAELSREWAARNPELKADVALKTRLGLPHGTYARMFVEQNGVCAICGDPPPDDRRLAVDHCKVGGEVRGLLCSRCNTGIGQLLHSVVRLEQAIAYLKRTEAVPTG